MNGRKTLDEILESKIARRKFLGGSFGTAAAITFLGSHVASCGKDSDSNSDKPNEEDPSPQLTEPSDIDLITFDPIDPIFDAAFDSVKVAAGYTAVPFFAWGDPVVAGAPSWRKDGSGSAADQELQAGQNHDGMHYFPIDGSSEHGLLVMNHEYLNQGPLHPDGPTHMGAEDPPRPAEEVRKEQAAHGVSVIEVRKVDSEWQIVADSNFNRRIHGNTPIGMAGPIAGHKRLKTLSDPDGSTVLGTFNNCAMGFTPWGTYLACEENFHGYFGNATINEDYADDKAIAKEISTQKRYRVGGSRYRWDTVDSRFDVRARAELAHDGHLRELNRFGWVVEIDPFDPSSKPMKRTALGRFIRECATLSMSDDGSMAFYMADDTRGEYIYKFVPTQSFDATNPQASRNALDEGLLYVAVFNDDGSGEWRLLQHGMYGLTAINGFADQADVLINTRGAADIVGATPMDRPEWVAVHPESKEIFVTLTNNTARGNGEDPRQDINAANPRADNKHGHIIKIAETNASQAATSFTWDIFLFAGDPSAEEDNLKGNIVGDIFSSPDGLYFDHDGRLWIQTDYGDDSPDNASFGLNQMLAADPETKQVRRFLVGPKGCEVTGVTTTPDGTTMWINIQHPRLSFPASDGQTRPRSATVVIQKDDGGVIGT